MITNIPNRGNDMLDLVKLENSELTDGKIKELRKICWWVNNKPTTDVYELVDKESGNSVPKSVFILKQYGATLNPMKEMDFGTPEKEQGKGYAKTGFALLLKKIKERPEISEVYIQAFNPATSKIASKFMDVLESDGQGTFRLRNPSFDTKYNDLCKEIKEGTVTLENAKDYCGSDKKMLSVANTWIKAYEQEKKENQSSKQPIDFAKMLAEIKQKN